MSPAFPCPEVLTRVIHRPPLGPGWVREDELYERMAIFRPDDVAEAYFTGKLMAVVEEPAGVVWLRPRVSDAECAAGWLQLRDDVKALRAVR